MRDFLVVLIVFGSVPLTLVRPQIGILMWYWISLMNPHRMAWGYAQNLRVALVVAVATVIGWIPSRESKMPPNSAVMYVLGAFTLWISLSAVFAIHPEIALPKWEESIKIIAMTFVMTCMVRSREQINQLVWVMALSLGFFGFKGGIFTFLTGGGYRIYGPPGSFIEDNNALALALIMTLPLLQYLRIQAETRWVKLGLLAGILLTIVAVLGSYSRGALLGLAATLGFWLLKSNRRIIALLLGVGAMGAVLFLFPQQWVQRMESIDQYKTDASAEGRFQAWTFAYRLALDHPFFGGGQLIGTDSSLYHRYVPEAMSARAAHSIYFENLGESGFVGLGLFLVLLITSYRAARKIVASTRDHPDLAWARSLAAMVQISFVGYAVAGAFLSVGFFDFYYALVGLIAVTQVVVKHELAKTVPAARTVTSQFQVGRATVPPVGPVAQTD